MKLLKKIHNNKGSTHVFTCIIIMAFAMLISLLWLYASCVGIVRGNRTYVSQRLDAYLSLYMRDHTELMVYGNEVYDHIDGNSLKNGAISYIGADSGEMTTKTGSVMKDIKAEYISGEQFGVKLTYDLYIPVSFLGHEFNRIKVHMKVRSRAVPIF